MKRVRKLIVMVLALTFLISSTCYAGNWKTLSINTTTKSYSTSAFQSDGDMLIDLSVYQTYSGNIGTLEVQRLVGNEWRTVSTFGKSLKVGVYTSFSNQVKNSGTMRLVFTSDKSVKLSGTIQYFIK